MKKKVSCIIDFGQSHLKFILITGKFRVARTIICKNNFKFLKKNCFFYDNVKIEKIIKSKINILSQNFKITSLAAISHGSGCFFKNNENNIISGFHFSSKFNNNKLISQYNKLLPSFSETYTPKYKNFHNLSKNLFLINNNNQKLEFMTIPSYIAWIFTKKNIIDPSYLSCHSFLWNFKKRRTSDFLKNISIKIPKIKNSGSSILYSKKMKIYNGMHDTSAAFNFHKIFFKDSNVIFLSTGTTFVFGKYLKKIQNIEEKSKFYYLLTTNFKGAFLSRRFQGGSIYDKNRKLSKKAINDYLALKTIKELKTYKKFLQNKNIKLIIDGYFAQNKKFVLKIKENNKNISIYCAKNKYTPCLGMASLFSNKKSLLIKNFYDVF